MNADDRAVYRSAMAQPLLKIKIQLFCGEEVAMGPGKADLLDAIAVHGSISAAGRALGMSYRRTWLLVDVMNRCWHAPLVETSPGSTGGARITPFGAEVLRHYRGLQLRVETSSQCPDSQQLAARMLVQPKVSQKD